MNDKFDTDRRTVLFAAAAGLSGVAGCIGSRAESGGSQSKNSTTTTKSCPPSETMFVKVGGADYEYEPGTDYPLPVPAGTTVRFVWESDNHNILVDDQPSDASWQGVSNFKLKGFVHQHTFTVPGEYHFYCEAHKSLGEKGTIIVPEDTTSTPAEQPTESSEKTPTPNYVDSNGSAQIAVGPDDNFLFEPGTVDPAYITPGTTITFEWKSDNHNIIVDEQPADADWQGVRDIKKAGFTHEHTFDVEGQYHFWCEPHKAVGMVGDIVVQEK